MIIYDTMQKKKVSLDTLEEGRVGIYLCGPTVYDYAHLGHGRSAIVFDLLRRYLMHRGYEVIFVRNWTDIDDKTIDRAAKEGVSVRELTERFIDIYREDYGRLNILEPDHAPKPTDHIDDMLGLIQKLFDRGHAYALNDGIYYDISTYGEYGKLSGQSLDELRSGARVEVSGEKRNPGDFVLWKFEKPGEPSWESPWGRGRPGWHIECSVMSLRYLGETFDIHCGGQDLIFPHHEDEVAQSAGAGYGFARYWMHNGFLNIDNEKMSKSLGNFFTLRDIFKKYRPLTVRFFLLSAHYRAPLNFSEENLQHAGSTLKRYNDFIIRVREAAEGPGLPGRDDGEGAGRVGDLVNAARKDFEDGLDDDLNISRALAAVAGFVHSVNSLMAENGLSKCEAETALRFMEEIDEVLGVFTFERGMLPEEIEDLIRERRDARTAGNYGRADEIRDELLEQGIVLEDTKDGTRWKRV